MNREQIVNQLKAVLPRYTTLFTNNTSITSLTRSANIVTATTDGNHHLQVGDKVLVNGAKTPIQIESLTHFDKYALAITTQAHQLAEAIAVTEISGAFEIIYNGNRKLVWQTPKIEVLSITISGDVATVITKTAHGLNSNSKLRFDIFGAQQSPYNQENIAALSVIDSTSFTYRVYGAGENALPNLKTGKIEMQIHLNEYTFLYELTGNPSSPATGDIYQLSLYKEGYNGYKTVLSVDNPDEFTYAIDSQPLSPAQGSAIIQTYPTITSAVNLEKAFNHFQSENNGSSKDWIYVILGDEIVSKDTRTTTDALNFSTTGAGIRENSFQDVDVYVILACGKESGRDELLAGEVSDLAASLKPAIFKSLLGFRPASYLTEGQWSRLMHSRNGVFQFVGSYLVYLYKFQATSYTYGSDAIENDDLFAFREFDFDVYDQFGYNQSVMKIQGRVDE